MSHKNVQMYSQFVIILLKCRWGKKLVISHSVERQQYDVETILFLHEDKVSGTKRWRASGPMTFLYSPHPHSRISWEPKALWGVSREILETSKEVWGNLEHRNLFFAFQEAASGRVQHLSPTTTCADHSVVGTVAKSSEVERGLEKPPLWCPMACDGTADITKSGG